MIGVSQFGFPLFLELFDVIEQPEDLHVFVLSVLGANGMSRGEKHLDISILVCLFLN